MAERFQTKIIIVFKSDVGTVQKARDLLNRFGLSGYRSKQINKKKNSPIQLRVTVSSALAKHWVERLRAQKEVVSAREV